MGNAPPISEKKLKELRLKYDKDDNGLSWEEFRELAVEVGELQGLSKPVSDEKLRKIFEGLDADKSGIVSIQEFEAAYAKLEEQLQPAAKAKAKAKGKAKAEGKAKGKPKAKPKAVAEASGEADVSIFDALPGFGSFVPELPTAGSFVPELPDLAVGAAAAAAFAEDTRVPKAKAIPTPKKTKAPPLPEPAPPALSTHVPWSTQLKAADPDWYDEDDPGFSSSDDFPEVGEVPEEPPEELPGPAAAVPPVPKPVPKPKPVAAKGQNGPKARSGSPKAKAKGVAKPEVKPKVQPKGRAQGISAADGVIEDVFFSPIHRREAVAHPAQLPDPPALRVLQSAGGIDLVQQDPEVLSEPESQESVDSISGEIARSWDPSAKDARYSYARDRAVGFSEFWQPLKWSEEEWERRLLASGNLRRKVGIAKHTPTAPATDANPKAKAASVAEAHRNDMVEELIAPEKPKPRSQYPLATEVKPKFIDVPLSGLQGVAAEGAVSALRKTAKTPAAPVFGDDPLDDELYAAHLPLERQPGRPGEPLVPLAAVAPTHLRERAAPETPPDTPGSPAPRFGYPGWQAPKAVFSDSNRTLLRPMVQEVQPRHRQVEGPVAEYGDQPGRTWL